MKKLIVVLMVFISVSTVACNKTKITKVSDIDIAGDGNYSIRDMAVLTGNRGLIRPDKDVSAGRGYIYMCGVFTGRDEKPRCLTAKCTEQGKPVWYKLYPDQDTADSSARVGVGKSLLVTGGVGIKEEYIYVLAEEYMGKGQKQLVLLKYDSLGNRVFHMIVARSNDELNGSLFTDNTGNLYCAGYLWNQGSRIELFTCKYESSGDLIWSRSYQDQELDNEYVRFQLRYPNRLVCAGVLDKEQDLFYINFDSLGNAQDKVVYPSPVPDGGPVDIISDERGTVYIAENCYTRYGGGIGFSILVCDDLGKVRWRAYIADSAGDKYQARTMAIDDSGCVYIIGSREGKQNKYFLFVVKYDSAGTEIWRRTDVRLPVGNKILRFPWYVDPDYIHNRFEYRPASDMDIIGAMDNGIFIARYNTVGFNNVFAEYRIKGYTSVIGGVEDKIIVVNLLSEKKSRAILLKYEEFQLFGINRWD